MASKNYLLFQFKPEMMSKEMELNQNLSKEVLVKKIIVHLSCVAKDVKIAII